MSVKVFNLTFVTLFFFKLVLLFPGSTNLVGKFTQSVRRIVQDVKDEGTASGQTKEEVIETNERLRAVRIRLDESYDTAKRALVTLMSKYNDSKSVHNIFQRYSLLKAMIKVSSKSLFSFVITFH